MRQIFHALPWIPPKEPREVAELFSQYGVPLTYKSGQLLKSRGENNKLFLITKGAAATTSLTDIKVTQAFSTY